MTNDTTLKERIRRGDIVIGVNVAMTSTKAQLEDILGKDDYSFIAVDSQQPIRRASTRSNSVPLLPKSTSQSSSESSTHDTHT